MYALVRFKIEIYQYIWSYVESLHVDLAMQASACCFFCIGDDIAWMPACGLVSRLHHVTWHTLALHHAIAIHAIHAARPPAGRRVSPLGRSPAETIHLL